MARAWWPFRWGGEEEEAFLVVEICARVGRRDVVGGARDTLLEVEDDGEDRRGRERWYICVFPHSCIGASFVPFEFCAC